MDSNDLFRLLNQSDGDDDDAEDLFEGKDIIYCLCMNENDSQFPFYVLVTPRKYFEEEKCRPH